MTDDVVRFALAQCESGVGTATTDPRPGNIEKAVAVIEAAAELDSRVVVFGEMFLTGLRTDEWLPRWAVRPNDPADETVLRLTDMCARFDVTVITGTATIDEQQVCRNSVLVIGPTGCQGIYHKRHLARLQLPDGQSADEALHYSPGDLPGIFEMEWGTLGLQICYEVTFPELARCSMLEGAQVVLNCTASISGAEELWAAMSPTRAFENGLFFLVCSVVGRQGDEQYFGGSAAYDPHGARIAQAAYDAEDLLIVDVPVRLSHDTRREMNILAARRPALYGSVVAPNT